MSELPRFDVCVVGSANLDLVATAAQLPGPGETVLGTTFAEHPGGKGLNQAVAAARAGARVAFVGAIGHDAAGTTLRDLLDDEGIDTSGLVRVDAPTGRALIGVAAGGENSIIVVPGANAHVDVDQVNALVARGAGRARPAGGPARCRGRRPRAGAGRGRHRRAQSGAGRRSAGRAARRTATW